MTSYKKIETIAGVIAGRDAIMLDSIKFIDERNLKFTGTLNSNLCSGINQIDHFVDFELDFSGVVWFKFVELDFDGIESSSDEERFRESCFDVTQESGLVAAFQEADHSSKISRDHQHYTLGTYDTTFELIAKDYHLALGDSNPGTRA